MDWRQSLKNNNRAMPSNPEFFDMAHIRRLEEQFLPSNLKRDYEHTFGSMPDGELNRPTEGARPPLKK